MEGEEESGDDRGENMWEEYREGSSGKVSGTSGASTSGDNESLGGGPDGMTEAAEDGGGWQQLMWRQGRRGGCKVRARRKRGWNWQAGDGDGDVTQTEKSWVTATLPTRRPTSAPGAMPERTRKRRRRRQWQERRADAERTFLEAGKDGAPARTRSSVAPTTMVVAATPPGGGGGDPGGGRILGNFWV